MTIDMTAATLFVGMIATGYVLRFPLPPGTNRVLELWGLSRHQWGSVHYWLSFSLLAAIVVHIVLHWKWLVSVVGKKLRLFTTPPQSMFQSGIIVTALIVAAFCIFATAAHRSVREMPEPLHDSDASIEYELGTDSTSESRSSGTTSETHVWYAAQAILEKQCLACHGPDRQLGGLRLDRREEVLKPTRQQPWIVPGNAADSPLIEVVTGARPDMAMLDRHELPEQEVKLLTSWINAGAYWPDDKE